MRTGFWSNFSILLQVLLGLGSIFGGIFGFVFFLLRNNYQLALWGFFTALFALAVIHLHILFLRNDLDDWYQPNFFDPMKNLAFIVFLLADATVITFCILGYRDNQVLSLDSYYMVAIEAAVCTFWCLILMISTRKYKRYVQMCQPILPQNRF